jgi:hypothetical protein
VLFTTYQGGKPQPPSCRGNAEGARVPRGYVVEKTRPGASEQGKRSHDHPRALWILPNGDNNVLSLVCMGSGRIYVYTWLVLL